MSDEKVSNGDKNVSGVGRLILWIGVFRRFFLFLIMSNYVNRSIKKRKGACSRCGTCCKLLMKSCIHLRFDGEGNAECKKYKSFRMPNCKIFPIDKADIRDRDLVSSKPCGYYFE
jgi:hypothetical protein